MDEIAQFDVPNVVDYICQTTGLPFMEVIALGQGCLPVFAALSINPELNVHVKRVFAFQPTIQIEPTKESYFSSSQLFDLFGKTSFASSLSYLTRHFPRFTSPIMKIVLTHGYGCNFSKLGTSETALALQSHTLSTCSMAYFVVNDYH